VLVRQPRDPRLRGIVRVLWATNADPSVRRTIGYESVLPTGVAHLAFRLGGEPLRLKGRAGDESVGWDVVGGSRDRAYVREIPPGGTSVGAQLEPGAARLVIGAAADELADRHTPLEDLWGNDARRWRERLGTESSLAQRLDRFEALLASRITTRPDRFVVWAIERIGEGAAISEVVEASGFSHRHAVSLFRREVGLPPKRFARVLRFQRAIASLAQKTAPALADVAHAAGYADQSHLTRELQAMSGLSPGRYLALRGAHPNHVPWVNFVQDGR